MGARQISDGQRRWLDGELEFWRSAGLLQPTEVDRIRGCYETTAETGQRKHSVARFTLQALAALLFGLAVLLLVGYNWDELHWVAKLALIFSGITGLHALGLFLRFSRGAPIASEIAFFLGCLLYGAGIWLVAQIFHLDAHYPDGVWWWAVGVLPFALCLDTLLMHALLAGLLALWAGMEVIGFGHLSPFWFWSWWPNGAYSLPLLAAPGLFWSYRRGSASAVALYVALITWWVVLQAIAFRLEWQTVYVVGMVGAILWILGENHRAHNPLARPYRVYGTLLIAGALIGPSYRSFSRATSRSDFAAERYAELITVLVILAALAAASFLLRPLGSDRLASPFARLFEVSRRQWMPLGIALAMALMALVNLSSHTYVITILANVLMIAFAVWLMHVGLREEDGGLFSAGVAYFLLWSILRYFDLFGAAGGMLGAAVMFFLCGAALFGLAHFWGRRKELLHA